MSNTNTLEAIEDRIKQEMQLDPLIPLIKQRGSVHGNYATNARYSRALKRIVANAEVDRHRSGLPPLTDQQRQSLDVIMDKAGRILAGDPSFADHWVDIGGYAKIANMTEEELAR